MGVHDIPENLLEEARNCSTTEELFALAKREGYELSEEELASVAGGSIDWDLPHDCTTLTHLVR